MCDYTSHIYSYSKRCTALTKLCTKKSLLHFFSLSAQISYFFEVSIFNVLRFVLLLQVVLTGLIGPFLFKLLLLDQRERNSVCMKLTLANFDFALKTSSKFFTCFTKILVKLIFGLRFCGNNLFDFIIQNAIT